MTLVSARNREDATQALHRHFVSGRLTLEEFAERTRLALQARDGRDLRRALADLPPVWRDGDELGRIVRTVKRSAVRLLAVLMWLFVSGVLLLTFVVSTLVHGVTGTDLVAFPLAWLLVTALAWRVGRRP